jgi:translation initiation factor 2B subunit (eIF-2B alpha/beta/delta family)
MLPILTTPVDGRRVSIFNPAVNPTNPMRGVELTNDTGMHLMPGPIAVYDAGTYAGDAQIPHTSRTQTRLLSYSLDLPVRCETEVTRDSSIRALSIDNGVLVQTNKSVRTTAYRAENNDEDRDRTLLIEHPRAGGWELVSPEEASETLSNAYRFEMELGAGGAGAMEVREEFVSQTTYALVNYDIARLEVLVRDGRASRAVLDAVQEAASMQGAINRLDRRLSEIRDELASITNDQGRLRENIRTVREGSDLYQRYLDKLTEQEDRIEALESTREQVQRDLAAERRRLANFLRNLRVD